MGLAFYVMKVGMGRQCKEEEKEELKGRRRAARQRKTGSDRCLALMGTATSIHIDR